MKTVELLRGLCVGTLMLAAACGAESKPSAPGGSQTVDPNDLVKPDPGKSDSSVVAVFLDFEFDGEVFVTSSWNANKAIEDQMLYTIGQLNGDNSVGRIDKLDLTNVETTDVSGGKRITYHAKLPVAWGKRNNVPTEYTLRLPRDGSFSGYDSFAEKYGHDCVDWGAHDVDSGSMWYYYRPNASRCNLDAGDVVDMTATVTVSSINTTGKYPEYHKIWEDDVFKVTAIFGKFEDGATSNSDAGIRSYNTWVQKVITRLGSHSLETTPADIPAEPGVAMPDTVLKATLPDGKRVEVTSLLVDNVRTAGSTFNNRYNELSGSSDLIGYSGHAGLGANIRALANKGSWLPGQYSVVFMNGCDTYAYVDSALWDAHAAVNPDDPTGTKYTDIITNALPASAFAATDNTLAFFDGLLNHEDPQTFEQMFAKVSANQVVLVSGEEDNEYVPGGGSGGGGEENWGGMEESGTVANAEDQHFETPTLAPGSYRFDLSGSNDADLYVRIGQAPTLESYDCRPYRYGSKESCRVDLSTDAPIYVMVRGWASSSDYVMKGVKE